MSEIRSATETIVRGLTTNTKIIEAVKSLHQLLLNQCDENKKLKQKYETLSTLVNNYSFAKDRLEKELKENNV